MPTPGYISGENHNSKRYMYPIVHCSTVTIARTWKQPKCPSTEKRIHKKWYIYTMKYYSAIKRNGVTNIMKLEFVLTNSTKQVTTDQLT